jgi:hypothetical protein
MYVYMYVCTCMYPCTHTVTKIYVGICLYIHMQTHTHTRTCCGGSRIHCSRMNVLYQMHKRVMHTHYVSVKSCRIYCGHNIAVYQVHSRVMDVLVYIHMCVANLFGTQIFSTKANQAYLRDALTNKCVQADICCEWMYDILHSESYFLSITCMHSA